MGYFHKLKDTTSSANINSQDLYIRKLFEKSNFPFAQGFKVNPPLNVAKNFDSHLILKLHPNVLKCAQFYVFCSKCAIRHFLHGSNTLKYQNAVLMLSFVIAKI